MKLKQKISLTSHKRLTKDFFRSWLDQKMASEDLFSSSRKEIYNLYCKKRLREKPFNFGRKNVLK